MAEPACHCQHEGKPTCDSCSMCALVKLLQSVAEQRAQSSTETAKVMVSQQQIDDWRALRKRLRKEEGLAED